MCKAKRYKNTPNVRIDKCMINLCKFIDSHPHCKVLASCCGHGKYNQSIVIKYLYQYDSFKEWRIMDLISDIQIPRTRNFYKRDKQGYYYIPEVVKNE